MSLTLGIESHYKMQRMNKYIRYFTIYDTEDNYVWEVEGYKYEFRNGVKE